MPSKHLAVYRDMISSNQDLFTSFKEIHDLFAADKTTNREKFNEIGEKVVDVIRRYEKMLCSKTDSGGFGKYSFGLADKYWEDVRHDYPFIDFVGVE